MLELAVHAKGRKYSRRTLACKYPIGLLVDTELVCALGFSFPHLWR